MDLGKTPAVRYEKICAEHAGQRIDNWLTKVCKGVPKSLIYRVLRSGEVRVNRKRVDQTYRIQEGDEIRIPPLRVANDDAPRPVPVGEPLAVSYEDDALLVLEKRAGQAVHGGSGVSFGVIEQLRAQRPQAKLLELAHRLDRETSGLLIVAKKRSALTKLHDMMREGKVHKRYYALVLGHVTPAMQHVRVPLLKYLLPDGERRVRVSAEGKPSHSIVRVVKHYPAGRLSDVPMTLVEVELKTGRTHQIRVHMAHLGHVLAGDDKYGDFARNKMLERHGLKRMFLHAAKLSFAHPLTDDPVALQSELPPELAQFCQRLAHEHKA